MYLSLSLAHSTPLSREGRNKWDSPWVGPGYLGYRLASHSLEQVARHLSLKKLLFFTRWAFWTWRTFWGRGPEKRQKVNEHQSERNERSENPNKQTISAFGFTVSLLICITDKGILPVRNGIDKWIRLKYTQDDHSGQNKRAIYWD